ncbi:MAG: hypothetical protein KBD01_12020 [Acidobacteria bacterium]|nr:hypothetical protein [Acidobacteriota bacterium]
MPQSPQHCPFCGTAGELEYCGAPFVEDGPWLGDAYANAGPADGYSCGSCGGKFLVYDFLGEDEGLFVFQRGSDVIGDDEPVRLKATDLSLDFLRTEHRWTSEEVAWISSQLRAHFQDCLSEGTSAVIEGVEIGCYPVEWE